MYVYVLCMRMHVVYLKKFEGLTKMLVIIIIIFQSKKLKSEGAFPVCKNLFIMNILSVCCLGEI